MHKYDDEKVTSQGPSASKKAVGIVGARGYSGLELARLLLRHPTAKLSVCFASDSNAFSLADYLPEAAAASVSVAPLADLEKIGPSLHTIFLATPAEVSLELAPKILKMGVNVVDLSGAFRLSGELYPEWYGFEHTQLSALAQAHYGLVPFASPFSMKGPALVSNPGCYVTSVLMAIIPLLKEGLIDASTLVIDAKSGTTGAGKKASEGLLFSEVEGECLPYKVGKHQHFPEICAYAEKFAGVKIDPHFSTSLLNVRRGIISGIYARVLPGKTEADIARAFEKHYSRYPLVSHAAISGLHGKKPSPYALSLKRVVGSARTHLRYQVEGSKLYLHSLIDNLLKGAASQAVENFNRLNDSPAELGLVEVEGAL